MNVEFDYLKYACTNKYSQKTIANNFILQQILLIGRQNRQKRPTLLQLKTNGTYPIMLNG